MNATEAIEKAIKEADGRMRDALNIALARLNVAERTIKSMRNQIKQLEEELDSKDER